MPNITENYELRPVRDAQGRVVYREYKTALCLLFMVFGVGPLLLAPVLLSEVEHDFSWTLLLCGWGLIAAGVLLIVRGAALAFWRRKLVFDERWKEVLLEKRTVFRTYGNSVPYGEVEAAIQKVALVGQGTWHGFELVVFIDDSAIVLARKKKREEVVPIAERFQELTGMPWRDSEESIQRGLLGPW